MKDEKEEMGCIGIWFSLIGALVGKMLVYPFWLFLWVFGLKDEFIDIVNRSKHKKYFKKKGE
ncbi:hypothetical protein KKE60_05525 [Patescibacteria group bacterium]|nr:hypothetical protein [Patescibacteria group bacterium]